MAKPPWPCCGAQVLQWSHGIFSTGRDALLPCMRDLCWGHVLWHRGSVPTHTLVVSPMDQPPHASHWQGQEISGMRVSSSPQKPPP